MTNRRQKKSKQKPAAGSHPRAAVTKPRQSKARRAKRQAFQWSAVGALIAAIALTYTYRRNALTDHEQSQHLTVEAGKLLTPPGARFGRSESFPPSNERYLELVKAKELLDLAIARDPENAQAWKSLGDFYTVMHDYDEANDSFAKALAIDPDGQGSHVGLGFLHAIQGNYSLAEEHFRKAIALNPCYSPPTMNWAFSSWIPGAPLKRQWSSLQLPSAILLIMSHGRISGMLRTFSAAPKKRAIACAAHWQ